MKNEKGITLIALIITIIVMIILVGVTVNIAINGGLFGQARDAVRQQEEQTIYEQILGMTVWNQDGSINVKATVEAIENSGMFTIKSKNPAQITDETTEVTITITGKNGEYSYLITTEEITILEQKGGGGGETDLEHLKALLEGETISQTAGDKVVATGGEELIVFNIPGETIKYVDMGFGPNYSYMYITVAYKGNYYDVILDSTNMKLGEVSTSSYTPPVLDSDNYFTFSITDTENRKITITGLTDSGKTKLTNEQSGALVIPTTILGTDNKTYTVTKLNERLFNDDREVLYSLEIPASVVEIGKAAFFNNTNLSSVQFYGSSLLTIGNDAFHACTNLHTVELPSSVNSLGNDCFSNSGITSINIEETNITTISPCLFSYCEDLTEVSISSKVTDIRGNAFNGSGITTVNFDGTGATFDEAVTGWYSANDGGAYLPETVTVKCTDGDYYYNIENYNDHTWTKIQ